MSSSLLKRWISVTAILSLFILPCANALGETIKIVKIVNNIEPIQIGATVYDNGGNPGNPTINIWPSGSSGSGETIIPGGFYNYKTQAGSSVSFGIQVNSARMPSLSAKCDQLCNHIEVKIAQNGKSCTAANATGTCGDNQDAPKWTATLSANMSDGVCTVSITKADTPPIVCGCQYGHYPCTTKVMCGPDTEHKTCPMQPPYTW